MFSSKVFIISYQKSGTKSIGKFFKDHGFRVASNGESFKNEWSLKFLFGNYNDVFKSSLFKSFQVYEDDPWWFPDIYKLLFHRFPRSKFILVERDSESWFNSMKAYRSGKTIGNTYMHSKIYRREYEYFKKFPVDKDKFKNIVDSKMRIQEEDRQHYKKLYEMRMYEIKDFFSEMAPERFYHTTLDNDNKWVEIGAFLHFKVDPNYDSHINKNTNNINI